ncbi:MAG: carbonic anhydrase [Gammaproteobacteria bacterium]|nr:MAG: carbonic anhydrase [Gammaproteobacteria bacterium]
MISAQEALERLRQGNRRFAADIKSGDTVIGAARRGDLVAGQEPFAVILGCSDSRAPVEIVFDQGLGDLFVIRVAGNIVGPSQIGSVEFAATQFATRLVVVLGHSRCGAVTATVEQLQRPTGDQPTGLRSITDRIAPAIEPLLGAYQDRNTEDLMHKAIRANVHASVGQLRDGSETLKRLIDSEGLRIVGAEYSLETGLVDFFDGAG